MRSVLIFVASGIVGFVIAVVTLGKYGIGEGEVLAEVSVSQEQVVDASLEGSDGVNVEVNGEMVAFSEEMAEPISTPEATEVATSTPELTSSTSSTIKPKITSSPTSEVVETAVALPSPTLVAEPTSTPTPLVEPRETPDVWSPPDQEPLFAKYAGQYSVDKNALERIANCESHFNPNAVNGIYVGMFQFAPGTWQSQRVAMEMDGDLELRKNVEESIRTAAFLVSRAGTGPWKRCI